MRTPPLLPGDARFPRNAWYVAGHATDLSRKPLHRKLLGEEVVLYRTEQGDPVALFDRCPHRGYPLSEGGVLVGDRIQCQYHGLQFEPNGHCALVPSGERRPERIKTQSFPVVDRYEMTWIWAGDPELADSNAIPDFTVYGYGQDGLHYSTGVTLEFRANYLMQIDNLLDATHITYLHEGQIDTGDVAGEPLEFYEDTGRVFGRRTMRNEVQAPLTRKSFGIVGERAHRTVTTEAWPPAICGVRVDFEEVDTENPSQHFNQLIVGVTPVDEKNTVIFTAGVRSFPSKNPDAKADSLALLGEDAAAMEAIQRVFDRIAPTRRVEYGLAADQAQYRARQIIVRMLQTEDGETSTDGADDQRLQTTVHLGN